MRREICKFKTGSKKVLPADSAVALSPPDPSNYRHGRPTSGYSANAPRPLGEREGGVGKKIQNCYRRHIWTVPCANFEHEVERDSQVDVVDDAGGVDGLEAPLGLPLDDGAGHDERNVDDDEEEGEDAEGDLPGWQFNRHFRLWAIFGAGTMDIQALHTYVFFKNHFGTVFGRFFNSIELPPCCTRYLRVRYLMYSVVHPLGGLLLGSIT